MGRVGGSGSGIGNHRRVLVVVLVIVLVVLVVKELQRMSLHSVRIKIGGMQPVHQGLVSLWPVGGEQGIPIGIAIGPMRRDAMTAKTTFVGVAQSLGGVIRRTIVGIALPFQSTIAERVQGMMGQPKMGFRGGGGSGQGPSMCDIVHFGRPMSRLCRNKRRHARDNARFVVVGSVSGSSVVVVVVLGQNAKNIGTHKGCGIRMLIVAGRCFGRLNGLQQLVKVIDRLELGQSIPIQSFMDRLGRSSQGLVQFHHIIGRVVVYIALQIERVNPNQSTHVGEGLYGGTRGPFGQVLLLLVVVVGERGGMGSRHALYSSLNEPNPL